MTIFNAKEFLARLTTRPGVYQMLDAEGELLYIGKAKNLKNRVASYFRSSGLTIKTQALVAKIADINITVTHGETEALLLEQNLIKQYRPPYNILLRDDKSYPYIFINDTEKYPSVTFHRGAKRRKGKYFGPFPSGTAVRETLNLLQKIFQIRQCDESFFKNRSRPCLQHQIKRCSAPCVELIDPVQYNIDINHAIMFLEGKSTKIMSDLATEMESAAATLDFERAAMLRDQIQSLQHTQEQQSVIGGSGNADIVGCAMQAGAVCIYQMFVRGGRVIGTKALFPKVSVEESEADVISAFLAQWYLSANREIPESIIISHEIEDAQVLQEALSSKRGAKLEISANVRGNRAGWQRLTQTNAEQQLANQLASKQNVYRRFVSLQKCLNLEVMPKRLECFDISHSSGEATVASCVVFDHNGPLKTDYRRFNIEGVTAGDDYAAMHQALMRRFSRLKKGEGKKPDILFIDGGKGQVTQALDVLKTLEIFDIQVIGIAKGVTRKPGLETLINPDTNQEIELPVDSPGLHLVQHIRDESHRFAITGHRARRGKARQRSKLEDIAGVGPKRRRELLKHFGSIPSIESAGIEEIKKVSTISTALAEDIYAALHPDQ
ncbi:MAG: excinuclease ABC subunit UvrC [Oceanospirillaceae bacterium]|nr:excinuclease ABC subunit UvrC [Oceanospirillaceae bacterium]